MRKTTAVRSSRRKLSRHLKKILAGSAITPRRTPPQIVYACKNPCAVKIGGTGSGTKATISYTIGDVMSHALLTIGMNFWPFNMYLQILSISVWDLSGNPLLVGCYDLTSPNLDEIQIVEDQPGRNQWACVGYVWPKSHQKIVFHGVNDAKRVVFYIKYPNANVTYNFFVKLNVLWRSTAYATQLLAEPVQKLTMMN